MSNRVAWGIAVLLWMGCVAGGFALLAREQFTPVPKTAAASLFPADTTLPLAVGQPTLIVFLHPHCPCSRATLHELARVMAETGNHLAVDVVFTIPHGTPPDWEKGDLWEKSRAMPRVRVVRDVDGVAARRFNVVGSGHTLLYDVSGHLLFSGGITASRGEEGDNVGEKSIVDLVLHGQSDVPQTPVFGCSLL